MDLPESSVDFTYDEAGNRVRSLFSDGLDLEFTYDELNRLVDAGGQTSFQYDANGRLVGSGAFTATRTPKGQLEILTLEPGKTIAYAYDSRNLLATVTDWLGGLAGYLMSLRRSFLTPYS